MKKILLSLVLICSFAMAKAQVVLNELYAYPSDGRNEFIELYNSGGPINLDCFTIVTYWSTATAKGWYVLDLPSYVVGNQDFVVIGPDNIINVQGTPGVLVDINWNDATALAAGGGFLKIYTVSGGGYTVSSPSGPITDFLVEGDFAPSQNTLTFLYQNGVMINGFWGGGPSGTLDPDITAMPDLAVTGATGCSSIIGANGDFSTFTAIEFKNQAGGTDNGYAREFDGKCGSWRKTSSQANHTPGLPNGSAAGVTGAMNTAQTVNCTSPSTFPYAVANFDVTGIVAPVTLADDFPVILQIYRDVNLNDTLDGPDTIMGQKAIPNVAATGDSLWFIASNAGEENVIFAYKTKRGCFDKVVAISQQCGTLPVNLKSFTAARSGANISLGNVTLIWETATEENNKGFYIQRKIGASDWRTVGFVPSQAVGGNSFNVLRYEYIDNNPSKGISQYRLRQVDFDYKSSYSNIRAVRGLTQRSNVIIYPNPSNDGKVNVVFEDVNVVRNVSLMDMSGRMLKQWRNVTNNNIQIDNLTPGFYSVRIENTETGELAVEKIVVNKR